MPKHPPFEKGNIVGKATLFPPGTSGNPGGRPVHKPLSDAVRKFLDKPYTQLNVCDDDTAAEASAKSLLRQAIHEGNVRAFIEAADRTEGRVPLPLVNGDEGGFVLNYISHIPVPDRRKPEVKKKSNPKVN